MTDTQLILNEIGRLRALVEERCPARKRKKAPASNKKRWGENKKVKLTDAEHAALLAEWGEEALGAGIIALDNWIAESKKGGSYDHAKYIVRTGEKGWVREVMENYRQRKPSRSLWNE